MGVLIAVNGRFFIIQTLISGYMVMSCLSSPVQANTFRWVDENGQVHYSDQIPPNEVDQAYSTINKEGVTINSVEKAKTKEQLAEEQRLKERQAEQERLARERQNYDHILLDTYSKVSDLEKTRDRYLATLEGVIKVAQHKLASLNTELDKLNKAAANLEQDGKAMSEDMRHDITNLQSQIDRENSFILAQRTQQKELREKFAADIKRFQELTAAQQSAK
jgi:Domain of unknown function (DUF4124)